MNWTRSSISSSVRAGIIASSLSGSARPSGPLKWAGKKLAVTARGSVRVASGKTLTVIGGTLTGEGGAVTYGKDEGEGQLDIHTVLAISPPYAKMLADLLLRAVDQYEDANGAIASATELATPFDIVLRSLPEFEDRARRLRARRRDEARAAGHPQESQLHPGKGR